MVQRRHLRLMFALACASLLLVLSAAGVGLDGDALLAVPVLLLLLPILGGRYLGEDSLARLAARVAPAARRPVRTAAPSLRRSTRVPARGGALIAVRLAHRGPPAAGLPLAPAR